MLLHPLQGHDRDGDILTYGIVAGEGDAAFFDVDPTSGQVTVVSELDYELGKRTLPLFVATLHDGKGVDDDNNVVRRRHGRCHAADDRQVDDLEEEGVVTLSDDEPHIGLSS